MKIKERHKEINRVLILALILNLIVSLLKFFFGLIANSLSMLADAAHSLFDSFSSVIGLIGIRIASKPPDAEHPYGHGKFENFATIFIAILIFITCYELIKSSIERFQQQITPEITIITFSVMLITLLINFLLSKYEYEKGKSLESEILISDSLHTKSDIFASISVILGFFFIKLGYPLFDPLIALLIAILIGRAGYGIIKECSKVLCDSSMLNSKEIEKIVIQVPGILGCHKIRTRGNENEIYLDLHCFVNSKVSVEKGHDISHQAVSLIKKEIPEVKDVIIHIEPKEKLEKN